MNEAFEGMRKVDDTIKAENANLKGESNALWAERDAIRKRFADTESRLLFSEQYSRNRNIEIKGIEEKPNENVSDIVGELGVLSGVPVTPQDIVACHCAPSKSKPNKMVVQFTRRQKRDEFFEKTRTLRLNNNDFGNTSTLPVFVNDHFCPILKRLLGMAVSKKRESGWKDVWNRNGKIYARKSDGSEVIAIKNECDL